MTATPNGFASPALAATPLPDGHDTSALYLRTFLLNCQLAVKANEVRRRQMLKSAIHALVAEQFGERIECLIDEATDLLYSRCCSIPDEYESDAPDPGDLNIPAPDKE